MVARDEPQMKAGMTGEEIARMEREMESLKKDFGTIETTYREIMITLTPARVITEIYWIVPALCVS